MNTLRNTILTTLVVGLAATAEAQVNVSSDIATSTTWTANNVYNLTKQIYVLPGATLTIQAGTVVASATTANGSGALAVARGGKINVQGTFQNPVIMTSDRDRATWTNNDPSTGTWRVAANEWGNLTIMGRAYISEDATMGNTKTFNANNVADMEGLIAPSGNPNIILYGGGNDDDNSGSISYLSLRYGGRVIGLANELNGLSLGGIGRMTDIHHVEVMNNVDDGIEIWGGTFNLKYFSIWNIGDDSLDIDQGYRGKVQFGLIVQGYSAAAKQGSGVGDNAIETDGAENSDYQPRTRSTMYNLTVIGQPLDGDGLTAWRDGAGVQYRNCIFMDCGEKVVRFDNVDGDGGMGYGHNGTTTWQFMWATPATQFPTVNAPTNPAQFYTAQTTGNQIEFKDSVFFNNMNAAAYTEADARGLFGPQNNNVREPSSSPIRTITRGAARAVGPENKVMAPVTKLDPRPANSALTSVAVAPNDGFFCPSKYRGAFGPGNNWIPAKFASRAFGFMDQDKQWVDLGKGLTGTNGVPALSGSGALTGGSQVTLTLANGTTGAVVYGIGNQLINLPFLGGIVGPQPLTTITAGTSLNFTWPIGTPAGLTLYYQAYQLDTGAPQSLSFSNTLAGTGQ